MTLNRKFYLLLLLLIAFRVIVIIIFSSRFTDHDQVTMWLGAAEMINGNFYEPHFWGQNYNSMMESLLSIPLLLIRIPFHVALPTVTSILSLFPFIFLAFLYKQTGKLSNAMILLLIPLILTVEFDLVTSMTRGWVTGLFVASLSFWSLFNRGSRRGWLLYGFASIFGLWLNPNAIFLVVFIGYYLLLNNTKNPKFYVYVFAGSILPVVWWVVSARFYEINPSYNMHGDTSNALIYSLEYLKYGFLRLDIFFQHMAPLYKKLGWPVFVMLLFMIFYLFRIKAQRQAIICLLIYGGIILAMGFNKVRDAHDTIFFTGARFFLFYPLLLVFAVIPVVSYHKNLSKLLFNYGVPVALLVFAFKVFMLLTNYSTIDNVGKKHWVAVDEVTAIKDECNRLQSITDEHAVELIVFETDHDQLFNYACPCLEEKFPETIFPWYERRTWRLMDEVQNTRESIMFVRPKSNISVIDSLLSPEPEIYILKSNEVKTIELLHTYNLTVRPF